jgi:riboflavin kinase/FMN adenylyltransferase
VKKISITLGNFDGIHLGHQALIAEAKALAPSVHVLTFHPHPASVLFPGREPVLLLDYKQQREVLLSLGVSQIEVIPFAKEFAKLSGKEFFSTEILSRNPGAVVVGHDFRFGSGRQAGVSELAEYCRNSQIIFKSVPAIFAEGRVVSSTWIRECLGRGEFSKAQQLLGRPFEFVGQVVEGKKLGRTLGFPTANLRLPDERKSRLPLSWGVYAGVARDYGPFVMNLGHAPTVNQDHILRIEVHFLSGDNQGEFRQNLYGKEIVIGPQFFLRAEKKFSSLDDLKNQIQTDVRQARELLNLKD